MGTHHLAPALRFFPKMTTTEEQYLTIMSSCSKHCYYFAPYHLNPTLNLSLASMGNSLHLHLVQLPKTQKP